MILKYQKPKFINYFTDIEQAIEEITNSKKIIGRYNIQMPNTKVICVGVCKMRINICDLYYSICYFNKLC